MCGSEHETGFVSQLNYKYDYDLIKRFILGAKKWFGQKAQTTLYIIKDSKALYSYFFEKCLSQINLTSVFSYSYDIASFAQTVEVNILA